MSTVRPFSAVRPTRELAEKVAALPYDVMTSNEAREMVIGNPYSFLHVDKAEIDLDKNVGLYDDAVYEKANANLLKMSADGVLIKDEKPNFYIYMQRMDGREQNGLVSCVSIDEYLDNTIKKHELTRADKEADRIKHVGVLNANTGPIFLTYHGKKEIDDMIKNWKENHTPEYDFVTDDNIGHTVWVVDDEKTIAEIERLFREVPSLYIADGHHRSASAVKVGLEKRRINPNYDGSEEFNYFLAVLFPSNELHIMDYNRVLVGLNGNSVDEFFEKLLVNFDVKDLGEKTPTVPKERYTFNMYIEGKWYLLTAKESAIDKNDIIAGLDVSILKDNVLEPIFSIQDLRTSNDIDFVGGLRGLDELKRRVDSGEMKLAFSMHPTSIGELLAVSDASRIMPPKTTWFEPKLRSGLFIHELE